MNTVWSQIEVGRPIYTVSQVVGDKWLAEPPFIGRSGELSDPFNLSLLAIMREFSSLHFTAEHSAQKPIHEGGCVLHSVVMRIKIEKI